jgi:hypothetical protein
MNMNLARHVAFALVLATAAWPTFAAKDHFWNCTTADGIKYADASKCDKGDAAVKVMKGNHSGSTQTAMVQATQAEEKVEGLNTGVCPTNPAYCTRPNYGVTEGSPRTQAIVQFLRKRECDFMRRFPERCVKPN